jgi:hypothetical protein
MQQRVQITTPVIALICVKLIGKLCLSYMLRNTNIATTNTASLLPVLQRSSSCYAIKYDTHITLMLSTWPSAMLWRSMKEWRKTHIQDHDGAMNTACFCNFMLLRKKLPFYPTFPLDKTLPRPMEPIWVQWKSKEPVCAQYWILVTHQIANHFTGWTATYHTVHAC